MSNILKLSFISTLTFFSSFAYSNSCIESVRGRSQTNEAVEAAPVLTEHNLLGFETAAAAIVWDHIRKKTITGITLTDALQDRDSIFDSLSEDKKTDINAKLQLAFAAIFNNEDTRGQVGYVVMSERHRDGFEFKTLSALFKSHENIIVAYLKDNLEAIIYNARRMTPLSWVAPRDLWTRVKTPVPLREKAVRFWKNAFYGTLGLAFILPHANLRYSADRAFNHGEWYEFLYMFHESASYIGDSWGYMATESIVPMAYTAAGFGAFFAVAKKITQFRGTRNSPKFDIINYNLEIGSDVRRQYTESEVDGTQVNAPFFVRTQRGLVTPESLPQQTEMDLRPASDSSGE